jgi:hypothetical protein
MDGYVESMISIRAVRGGNVGPEPASRKLTVEIVVDVNVEVCPRRRLQITSHPSMQTGSIKSVQVILKRARTPGEERIRIDPGPATKTYQSPQQINAKCRKVATHLATARHCCPLSG